MSYEQKTYLVTGGAGFIGSHLVESLISRDHHVLVIDDLSSGHLSNLPADIASSVICEPVQSVDEGQMSCVDGIFHLAAQASVPYSIEHFFQSSQNNLLSGLKVFEWAKDLRIPVVYASSSAVYGDLELGDDKEAGYDILTPYAQDKLTLEDYGRMMWKLNNLSSVGLRLFNVYGPRQDPSSPYSGVISIFIDRILRGESVTVNGGFQTRDFVFVRDVVSVMETAMAIMHERKLSDYCNVGTGKSVTIDELLFLIKNILDAEPEVARKDLPPGDPVRSLGTCDKIREILGVDTKSFTDLGVGLIETIAYVRDQKSHDDRT